VRHRRFLQHSLRCWAHLTQGVPEGALLDPLHPSQGEVRQGRWVGEGVHQDPLVVLQGQVGARPWVHPCHLVLGALRLAWVLQDLPVVRLDLLDHPVDQMNQDLSSCHHRHLGTSRHLEGWA